jgi:hypothetical protein
MRASTPTGTLTRNTQRHDRCASRPPNGGPSAAAAPPTAAQTLTAIARRAAGNAPSRRASDVGITRAAPTAWSTRKATSNGTDAASAQAAEPTVNTATPVRKTSRRPYRSARRPAGASSAANATV